MNKAAHAEFPHSRTVHQYANVRVSEGEGGETLVRCAFVVRSKGSITETYPGHMLFRLVRIDGALRIRLKRAELALEVLRAARQGEHHPVTAAEAQGARRSAIVTGVGMGIGGVGRAIAARLAADGYAVMMADADARVVEVAAEIAKTAASAEHLATYTGDLSVEKNVQALVDVSNDGGVRPASTSSSTTPAAA